MVKTEHSLKLSFILKCFKVYAIGAVFNYKILIKHEFVSLAESKLSEKNQNR